VIFYGSFWRRICFAADDCFFWSFYIVDVGLQEPVAGEFTLLDNDNLLHCRASLQQGMNLILHYLDDKNRKTGPFGQL
jgi:hypothetical protein